MNFGQFMFETYKQGLQGLEMTQFLRDNMDNEELSSGLLFVVSTVSDHPDMIFRNPWSIPLLNMFALVASERLNPGLQEDAENMTEQIKKFREQLEEMDNGDGFNFPN